MSLNTYGNFSRMLKNVGNKDVPKMSKYDIESVVISHLSTRVHALQHSFCKEVMHET